MSHWIDNLLDEDTVYWAGPNRDGLGDYSSWPAPVQLLGRWQYSSYGSQGPRIDYTTVGVVKVAKTSVWINYDVLLGSYLWLGLIADLPPLIDIPSDAYQVTTVKKVRSISSNVFLYKAYLDV